MRSNRREIGTELVELAPGIHAFVQRDGSWCLSNAGVLVDQGEAVVVDTAATEDRAVRLREVVGALSGTTARTVVNTHFHGDHTFGNCVFLPEAEIIAHENARDEAAAAGLGMRGLWPEVRWGAVELALPTKTYRDRAELRVGGMRVELLHPGPAHTRGDTVVWIPDRSVLFAGDVVMSGATPFCLMGSISGTLRTIAWLRGLGARTIVGGHGPVGGPELLDSTEAYLTWVQRLAAAGFRRGLTPLAVARTTDLGEYGGLLDPERLVGNLHRAYAELRGEPEGSELDVLEVFHEMVEYHGGPLTCFA